MQLAANMNDSPISPIEDILEDARNGKPYILVDAEDRENEGDVIIPAQFATPDQINFMARHARGLICLAITGERARQPDQGGRRHRLARPCLPAGRPRRGGTGPHRPYRGGGRHIAHGGPDPGRGDLRDHE